MNKERADDATKNFLFVVQLQEKMTSLKRQPSNSTTSGDDDAEDEVDCPLSDAEALQACKQFALLTSTDTALAMMILQQNGWDLHRAVNAYLDLPRDKLGSDLNMATDGQQEEAASASKVEQSENNENKLKTRFKLLSWNIDGLDELEHTLETRTRGVVDVIKREEPDAVFLQEVVPTSLAILRSLLPEYDSYAGSLQGYFVVIFTRREMFKVKGFEVIPYSGTRMNRHLLIVHAVYKDSMEIDLMTSHHESGTEELASKERIAQLKFCFKRMIDAPSDRIVLFGGDLNMREKELQKSGQIPTGICDLWIETGKRKECNYTWDMNRNTNLSYPSDNFKPRARFDRLYFRPSSQSAIKFKPVYFELEGLVKLPSIQRFCSDHWAIQAYFDL